MNTESGALYLLVISGGVFIIAAMIQYIFPPAKINYLYGYRTNASMKSERRWTFAQLYAAIAMIQSGVGMILLSGLALISPFSEKVNIIVACTALAAAIGIMLYRTEKAIKTRFPMD